MTGASIGSRAQSIVHVVMEHAAKHPERACFHCISPRRGDVTRTWREVVEAAGRAAIGWTRLGVKAGDVVVLVGTHHPDLYAAWLGAVWIGAVPTLLAEPSVRIHRDVYASRLAALLERIGAPAIAVDPRVDLRGAVTTASVVSYVELAASEGEPVAPRQPSPDDLLLLQHSSGTTGVQKGVMLTHGAVVAHAEAYANVTQFRSADVVASWLPLYHDMGLIACFVGPLLSGVTVAWLSPFEWVASPQTLLDAVEKHAATHCWLPNFAFLFLAQRAQRPARLSSLRHVVNCSEVVTAEAMDAFVERFHRDGLEESAVACCYAMAENVYAMTSTRSGERPRRRAIDRDTWRDKHLAVPPRAGAATLTHVSCGPPIPGVEVKIVGEDGARMAAGAAGRVCVRSGFLFSGYFRRPDLDDHLFDAEGFFDTGDLGYLDEEGHLVVTGRVKDVIIVAGKNVYPQDVEAVADSVPGIHPGRAVAFGVAVRAMGTDGVVVLAEADAPEADWDDVRRKLRAAVSASLDLDLIDVVVLPRAALRKSTSGKLARSGNRDWYLEGRFGSPAALVEGRGGDE